MKSQGTPAIGLIVLSILSLWSGTVSAQTSYRAGTAAAWLRSASYQRQDPSSGTQAPGTDTLQDPRSSLGGLAEAGAEEGERPIVITPGMLGSRQDQELPSLPQLEREQEPDQPVVVREKYAGWKQAGTQRGGAPIEPPLRSNWVLIDNTGRLSGTIVGNDQVKVAGLPVYLMDRGTIAAQTRTDEEGAFNFNNVSQGTYSLVGFGDDAFFAYGFNALDHKQSLEGKMPDTVRVMAVQNKTTINLDWIRQFASGIKFRVVGRHTLPEGSADPPELYGLDGLSTLAPTAVAATSLSAHEVSLDDAGTLVGRLHHINARNGRPVDVRGARVMLMQGDTVLVGADADNYGVFRFEKIEPGFYSLVAVSADGFACIGISAVNSGSLPGEPTRAEEAGVAEGAAAGTMGADAAERIAVDVSLTGPETAGWLNHQATEEAYRRIAGRPITNSGECQPCMDNNFQICPKQSGFRDFFRGMNAFFDVLFYGETFEKGYENGMGGMGGGNGGGSGTCAPGGMGGCGGCGNPGCSHCHPLQSAPVAAPACGGCSNPDCNHCHGVIEMAPATVLPGTSGLEIQSLEPTPVMPSSLDPTLDHSSSPPMIDH